MSIIYSQPTNPLPLLEKDSLLNHEQEKRSTLETLNRDFTRDKVGYKDFVARKKFFAENIEGMESMFDDQAVLLDPNEKGSSSNIHYTYEQSTHENRHHDESTNAKITKHLDIIPESSDIVIHREVPQNRKLEENHEQKKTKSDLGLRIVDDSIDGKDQQYTGESLIGNLDGNIEGNIKYHDEIERINENIKMNKNPNYYGVETYLKHNKSETMTTNLDENQETNHDDSQLKKDKIKITPKEFEHSISTLELKGEYSDNVDKKIKNNDEHDIKHTDEKMYDDINYNHYENDSKNNINMENILTKLYKSFEGWLQ